MVAESFLIAKNLVLTVLAAILELRIQHINIDKVLKVST